MRNYLLLILLWFPLDASALEFGATASVIGGGPSAEIGPALLFPVARGALQAEATLGRARGYGLRAVELTYQNTSDSGWYYGGGLRNEWILDAGQRKARVGISGEFGWQTAAGHRLRIGLKPMLFVVSIGPALGLGVTYFPFD